jgi:hypothetical protein
VVHKKTARFLCDPQRQDQRLEAAVSYGHPWAHYSVGYQDRLLGGPLGLLDLCYTVPASMECKDYRGIVLGYDAIHVRIHVKYSKPYKTSTLPSN